MNDYDDDYPQYDGPSKSQLKRDSAALQDLAAELVNMPRSKLAHIPLDEDLREAIAKLDQTDDAAVAHLHRLERWRERLLSEGNDALTELLNQYPSADSQRLRQMIRNAQQESVAGKPPKTSRELFKYLRSLME